MARTPKLEDLEASTNDTPPVGIPPGADVTVKFRHNVDSSGLAGGRAPYPAELAALAAEEYGDDIDEIPPDPLSEFCEQWYRYSGYNMRVTRLPDSAARRMPGQTYNRTCLEIESLGDTPFDPTNLQSTLQLINNNSGGVFRLWLIDENGRPIPDAHLPRVTIGDPPRHFGPAQALAPPQQLQPQPAREPSAIELRFQSMQEKLLENAMMRILAPEQGGTANPASQLSDEDRLTLLLVQQGGLLPTVVQRIAAVAGSPDAAAAVPTWKDRLADAAAHHIMNNPALVERLSSTVERITERIFGPRQSTQQWQPPPPQQLPQPQPQPRTYDVAPTTAAPTGLPESPSQPDDEDELEDELMSLLEDLFALLNSNDPLVANHPTFAKLQAEYPVIFPHAVRLIASQPLDAIIAWIKEKSPLYVSLLESDTTGPRLRQRLQELQTLCRTPQQSEPVTHAEQNEVTQDEAPARPHRTRRQAPPTS